ncbi:MAG: hypothetical protein WCH11_06995 [Bdellovibrio sp.]
MRNLIQQVLFRKKCLRLSLLGLFVMGGAACEMGPKVHRGAEDVKVAETVHELRACTPLGLYTVTGDTPHAGGPDDVVEVKAREQGKEMRATHVFVKEKGPKSRVYEAFRCK